MVGTGVTGDRIKRNFSLYLNIPYETHQNDYKYPLQPLEMLKSTFSLMINNEYNLHFRRKRT